MAIKDLTIKERILLHLFDYNRYAEEYEAPVEVTQGGIAEAVWIRVQHVNQYVKPLIREDLVEEKVRHIPGQPRRRKVYFLVHRGRQRAVALRSSLFQQPARFRRGSGKVDDLSLGQVYHEERRGSHLLDLLGEQAATGYISEMAQEEAAERVDFTQEAPPVDRFVGREKELETVLEALEQSPVVVVTGIAGIGKTMLGARICETFRGKRSLFWRRVRSWDTGTHLALRLATFLRALSRTGLHAFLMGRGAKDLSRIEEILEEDLAEVRGLLVFDDVHNASKEAQNFLSVLHEVLKRQGGGTQALVLSRIVPDFYSLPEVEVEASVREIHLRGLDDRSSLELLEEQGVPAAMAASLVQASGGSPLFLKLLAKSARAGREEWGQSSLEAYIAQEIEPSLSEAERECLQLASLYEVPVSSPALLLGAEAGARTLVSLQRKNILDRPIHDRFVLHDFLRHYFRKSLPLERRSSLATKGASWLLEEAEGLVSAGTPGEAIALMENAVAIEPDGGRRLANLERLGELRIMVGDWEGAKDAYRAVLAEARDPLDKARMHRYFSYFLTMAWKPEEAEREVQRGLALLPPGPSLEAAYLLLYKAGLNLVSERYEEVSSALDQVAGWLPELPEDPNFRGEWAAMLAAHHLVNPLARDYEKALTFAREAIEIFEAAGGASGWLWYIVTYAHSAQIAFLLGRLDEALAYLDRGWEAAEALGILAERGNLLTVKAHLLSEGLGEYDAAEELYSEALRWTKMTHQTYRITWFPRLFANLYRRRGRPDDARASLEYFLGTSRDTLSAEDTIESLALMVRVCVESGDTASAGEYLAQAEDLLSKASSDRARGSISWARGVLHGIRGEAEAAKADFEEALSMELLPFRGSLFQKQLATELLRGELLLDYGRLLASVGENEEAKETFLEALEEMRKLSRKPLEVTVLKELRLLGLSPPA